jgi:GNAT superfamily N-acetyltransferase
MEEWGRERAGELIVLVDASLPGEDLSGDELIACCWDDPGVVLASVGGAGVVASVSRGTTGFVRLLVVAPQARRLGQGRELLAGAEAWLSGQGCTEVWAGPSAPFYLWPGVDVRWTAALCLFEQAGYRAVGAELNMSCPTTHRASPPDGVAVSRVLEDADAAAVVAFCREHFPHWVAELERAVEHASCLVAREATGVVLGFCCHSVNRAGWLGPMATLPARQGGGVGSALLAAACRDLREAGHPDAEIAWVGPVGFYAKAAGASVSRVFRSAVKRLA